MKKLNLKKFTVTAVAGLSMIGMMECNTTSTQAQQNNSSIVNTMTIKETNKRVYASHQGNIFTTINHVKRNKHSKYIFEVTNLNGKKYTELFKNNQLNELKITYTSAKNLQKKDMKTLKTVQQYHAKKFDYFVTAYQHNHKVVYNVVLNYNAKKYHGLAHAKRSRETFELIEK